MAKIIIEHEKCIGCGSCAAVCDKYFEMAEDGKSRLKGTSLNEKSNYEIETNKPDCAEKAVEVCPVQCIIIEK